MKYVRILQAFEYKGQEMTPGSRIFVEDGEVDRLVQDGNVELIYTPENRLYR